MIRKTFFIFVFVGEIVFSQTNIELIRNLDEHHSTGYNDIWGYVDPMGNEYALLGVRNGTSIIDLSDPANPVEVAFIPATNSVWRDIKVHGKYAYVVSDNTNDGLQIIDLSQLPTTAALVKQVNTWFNSAHNIFIDNGFAYVIGTDQPGGGMHILDLSDPENPTHPAYYSGSGYIHDVYVWNDTVVACAENSYDLVDVSNKTNPQLISESAELPGIYAHSGWMTEDKRYFYATEEGNVRDITVWDLQDRHSWDLIIPSWQTNSDATVHNLFILGNYAHISYYTDGYVVLDISNPELPFLVGEYSTPNQWGCYPYLPSGITICSDMNNGLYVFQFTPGDVPPGIIHTSMNDVLNTDPFTISAEIIDNDQVVDANVHYRTTFDGSTSGWFLVNDLNGPTNNTYEFEIPGQQHLTTVEYYLAAVDDSNKVSTLPKGGSGINPLGGTPPPEFLSFKVILAGIPNITSFFPSGDSTIQKNGEIDFLVEAVDTSGLELSYKWFKNDLLVTGNNNIYHYRHSSFDPVPRTDVIKVVISNGYIITEKSWNVFVEQTTAVDDENNLKSYSLKQNYPNPFNPTTIIQYSISSQQYTTLKVYNLLGNEVATLVEEVKPAGFYEVTLDAANMPSGVYFYKLQVYPEGSGASTFVETRKMTLLR